MNPIDLDLDDAIDLISGAVHNSRIALRIVEANAEKPAIKKVFQPQVFQEIIDNLSRLQTQLEIRRDDLEECLAAILEMEDETEPCQGSDQDKSVIDGSERIKDLFSDPQSAHLHIRIVNALEWENIYTLRDLLDLSEADLREIPNIGRLSIKTIKEALKSRGLALRRSKE